MSDAYAHAVLITTTVCKAIIQMTKHVEVVKTQRHQSLNHDDHEQITYLLCLRLEQVDTITNNNYET